MIWQQKIKMPQIYPIQFLVNFQINFSLSQACLAVLDWTFSVLFSLDRYDNWQCKRKVMCSFTKEYRIDANRPSSYFFLFSFFVKVLFEIAWLARKLLPLVLFKSSFNWRARINPSFIQYLFTRTTVNFDVRADSHPKW